ncbi:MAG: hypothetical protein WCC53_07050 [Thermoanaerobaculia bacterium]|jgi:hypothetical protein
MTFAAFLRRVIEALDACDVPYMATGGVALLAYGEPRFTADADLVIAPTVASLECFLSRRDADWYVSAEAAREALLERGMFNLVETTTGWKADLIVVPDDAFSAESFSRRRPISALGVTLVGISPEDLVLSKLRWAATTDSERQIRDVFGVLTICGTTLDEKYMRRLARDLGVESTLEKLLRDLRRPA